MNYNQIHSLVFINTAHCVLLSALQLHAFVLVIHNSDMQDFESFAKEGKDQDMRAERDGQK